MAVLTPKTLLPLVWPLPRSLATTCGISVDFFSSPYLDVSVQAVPLIYLWIQYMMTVLYHRRIAPFGHPRIITPICGSPWLFAACRVLLRLPVPRHSPCALYSLTSCLFCKNLSVLSFSAFVVFITLALLHKKTMRSITLLLPHSQFPLFNFQGAIAQPHTPAFFLRTYAIMLEPPIRRPWILFKQGHIPS